MSSNLRVKRALKSYQRKYENFLHWYGVTVVDEAGMYECYKKARQDFKNSYEKYFALCNKYNKRVKFNVTLR